MLKKKVFFYMKNNFRLDPITFQAHFQLSLSFDIYSAIITLNVVIEIIIYLEHLSRGIGL